MAKSDFDIVIIGGGVSGLGVAYAAVKSGRRCLLIEKQELSSKTSSGSLRIIHGGLRYLQKFQIGRTLESIAAQTELIRDFPDLILPYPCLMPLSSCGLKSRPFVTLGIIFYKFLAAITGQKTLPAKVLSRREFDELLPSLAGTAKSGALLWHDAQLQNPLALAVLHKRIIAEAGSQVKENCEVTGVQRGSAGFIVTAGGADYKARSVVNCSGPWSDRIKLSGIEADRPPLKWTRAFNLIFRKRPELTHALGLTSSAGRLYFYTPRADSLAVGTFYYPAVSADDCQPTKEEVLESLKAIAETCPQLRLCFEDITGLETGILPAHGFKNGEADLLGREIINDYQGYLDVISIKYTTFRTQGRKIFKLAQKYLP